MMHKRKSERGQSLVIIAVVMVGLIALMGLAIDGGNVFMQRRRAQNAADAAALAGTRLLAKAINTCNADPVGTDAVLAREVNRYAERNGISDTNGVPGDETNAHVQATYVDRDGNALGTVGGGRVPEGATGIDVVVDDEHETYFLTVIGVDKAGSSANGRAMSGAITQFPGGGGILPLAVHLDVVQSLEQDEVWRVLDVTNEHTGGEFCVDGDDNGQFDDPADFCVGDTAAHNAHRGWLNLNYIYNVAHLAADDPMNRTFEQNVPNRPCGGNDDISTDDGLQGWATRGACPYPYPIVAGGVGMADGDFIHGSPGARQSTIEAIRETFEVTVQAIEDTFVGAAAYVPVFDYVYTSDYMADNFPTPEQPGSGGDEGRWPRAGGGEHAYLYHVVGFAAVEIREAGGHGSEHYIEGAFKGSIIGDGVVSPGSGFDSDTCQPSMVYGVSLWQ